MQFSLDTVRAVARLMQEADLGEIAVESTQDSDSRCRLMVRRLPMARHRHSPVESQVPLVAAMPSSSGAEVSESTASTVVDSAVSTEAEMRHLTITSTAVGQFRNLTPPLHVGDIVKAGQVIGIVESLKVPNEVTAPSAGRVVDFMAVEDQAVEYGQPLVTLEVAV